MVFKEVPPNYRDVDLINLNEDIYLAIACDSCGGIGEKERDVVKVPPYIVGRLTSRVALMEILSVGATPKAITAGICSEPEPTGEGIITGIREELQDLALNISLTISTEKNMPTCQTGLGLSLIGTVKEEELRINKTKAGDKLYCVGIPKVGNEIVLGDPQIADSLLINKLLSIPLVHDIIPVGSKGIKGEAGMLASFLGLKLEWENDLAIDIEKTAGPSTCVLVTVPDKLKTDCPQPIHLLAQIK